MGQSHKRTAPEGAVSEAAAPQTAPDRRGPDRVIDPGSEFVSERREKLVRETGGPQDEAHYSCSCGYQFTASVGTAVTCPNCGSEQAW